MITREPISFAEMATRTGRADVVYVDENNVQWIYDVAGSLASGAPVYQRLDGKQQNRKGSAISGTATITVAQLIAGALTFSGGVGTQTLPTATLLGAAIGAKQGTRFDFIVDNTAGSGTCTIAVGAGMTAAAVITGGNTLTVANSATVGVAKFSLEFFSATGAVLYRMG